MQHNNDETWDGDTSSDEGSVDSLGLNALEQIAEEQLFTAQQQSLVVQQLSQQLKKNKQQATEEAQDAQRSHEETNRLIAESEQEIARSRRSSGNFNFEECRKELDFSVLIPGAFCDSRYTKNIDEQRPTYFYCPGFFTRIYREDFRVLGHRLWNMAYQCQLLQRWNTLKAEPENWPAWQKFGMTIMCILLCIGSPIAAIAHFLLRLFITNTLACLGDLIGLTPFNANSDYRGSENFPQNETWSDTYNSFRPS